MKRKKQPLTLHRAKWIMAMLWIVTFAVLLLLLSLQSLFGHYAPRTQDAWNWFLPAVVPTVSLIAGVLVIDFQTGREREDTAKFITTPLFAMAFWLSVFYLVLVAFSIVLQPLLRMPPMEVMQLSNLWLVPMQSLTVGVLAAFFRSNNATEK